MIMCISAYQIFRNDLCVYVVFVGFQFAKQIFIYHSIERVCVYGHLCAVPPPSISLLSLTHFIFFFYIFFGCNLCTLLLPKCTNVEISMRKYRNDVINMEKSRVEAVQNEKKPEPFFVKT